jgi:hypothetical protein
MFILDKFWEERMASFLSKHMIIKGILKNFPIEMSL